MRPLLACLAFLALLAPASARAGGFGILTTAGSHGDRVYGYSLDAAGDYQQETPEDQQNANFGGGFEVILGDKDNRILGIFRGYYLQDAAQRPPAEGEVSVVRETSRDIGVITAGLQWGIIGDPTGLQLVAVANLGSGVFTTDFSEYLLGEAGVGGTWMTGRRIQVAATLTGGSRYRKRFYPTANAYVGVRYLFD